MPRFDEWDLDYRPEKVDKTGPNILRAALEKRELSWYDRDRDRKICRKALPRSLKEFAQLNPVLQSHLIAEVWHPSRGLAYNKTTNQYAMQLQRYFRKLYRQQFKKLPIAMQLKRKKERSFDLFTDPLYEKAADAINAHMRKALKKGVKSSAEKSDELEPPDVKKIFSESDPNNPQHVLECCFIALGVSRGARALAEWLEV